MSVFDKEAVEAWLNCDGPIESHAFFREYGGFGILDVWQEEYEEEENALSKMGF